MQYAGSVILPLADNEVAYVIYMAGVFDKRRGTISLPPLVREVKATGQLNRYPHAGNRSRMTLRSRFGKSARTETE
jgi:hypothetical protein